MGVLDLFKLDGKVALVTGAARGLGQAMAVGLAEAGANICLLDREEAGETAQQIQALDRESAVLPIDLSDLEDGRAQQIIHSCTKSLGGLDILVNNAGIIRRGAALEFSAKDWKEVLDINLNAVFYLSQAAGKHFEQAQKRGKIINMASMLSFQGGLTVPSYTAAKSAVVGLTRALANEWAAKNIHVNALAPGYLKTEVTAGIRSDVNRNDAILARIPAGRWGEPHDLKGSVVYLASDASNYLHGSILAVDGGWLAR